MSAALPEARILDLDRRQIYPTRRSRLRPEVLDPPERIPLVDYETPIVSIGSCFASRIKVRLRDRGYNYVQTSDSPAARPTSAAWGTVFNAFCVEQEFRRASRGFAPAEESWLVAGRLASPYRKNVEWGGPEDRARERARHEKESREALEAAEVLIVTLGLTEVWYSLRDRSVFYQVPPAGVFDAGRHAFRNSSVDENVLALRRALAAFRDINSDAAVVMTVSPVPLRATFRKDVGAVAANVHSKSTLVVAAREVAGSKPRVFYFPSFELVTNVLPNPFKSDNRHVTPATEAEVMALFDRTYSR